MKPSGPRRLLTPWARAVVLFALTLISTAWAGAGQHGIDALAAFDRGPSVGFVALATGLDFAGPLLAILVAHELGHYAVSRFHELDASPPYFIPMPIALLGTMGAVIRLDDRIPTRRVLLDVAAAGPLAGMTVALPLLVYGVATSPVGVPPEGMSLREGHCLLYESVLLAIHGSFPPGHDILLTPTAFAAWAGLLVTMINLVPIEPLDGGHIAYALLGPRQEKLERVVLALLPMVAIATGAWFAFDALRANGESESVLEGAFAGVHWLVWLAVTTFMRRWARRGSSEPSEAIDEGPPLDARRRAVAWVCAALWLLLFMPSWMRTSG